MSSTYSPDLRIEVIGTGDQAGVWGETTNTNLQYVIEPAVAGYVTVAVDSTSQALTYLDGGASTPALNQAVYAAIALTTGLVSGAFSVFAPPNSKQYTLYNATSYVATIYNSTVIGNTTAAGTGVAIPAGKTMTVWSDGTNFAQQNTHLNSPTMTTPNLGTPSVLVGTNITGTAAGLSIGGNAATATTATNATTATTATNAANLVTANFSVVQSGSKLYFKYGSTNIASLDSSGNFVALTDVTAGGTP